MTNTDRPGDRLRAMFDRTRAEGRPAVIPFVPGGWPVAGVTPSIVEAAIAGGADAMEIGVPFSDPLADGVTNQEAYQQALANGVTLQTIFDDVRTLRASGVSVPLLLMGYCNPLLAHGASSLVDEAVEAGVDGLIVVDLPPDEGEELEALARAGGLHIVYMLAPTSTDERIALVAEHGGGFIYCVSVTGVTGARAELPPELPEFVGRVRARTGVPLAVGFGISSRAHVEAVGGYADAVIIGSAFVREIAEAPAEQRSDVIRAFMEEMTGRGVNR